MILKQTPGDTLLKFYIAHFSPSNVIICMQAVVADTFQTERPRNI